MMSVRGTVHNSACLWFTCTHDHGSLFALFPIGAQVYLTEGSSSGLVARIQSSRRGCAVHKGCHRHPCRRTSNYWCIPFHQSNISQTWRCHANAQRVIYSTRGAAESQRTACDCHEENKCWAANSERTACDCRESTHK